MLDKYREPENLLSDPSFLSWHSRAGGDDDQKWEDWMTDRPDRKLLVQRALTLLEATRLPEKEPSPQQLQNAEAALFGKIASLPANDVATPVTGTIPRKTSIGRMRWIAAASVLIAIAAGIIIVKYTPHTRPELRTPYGQISSRQLPDGTEVTMNANSSLRYGNNWNDKEDREVWVDGEAFFHVRRTQTNSRFIVHSEHFDIIVTGTQFNVSNRHGKDNVLLQEGSVTIKTKDGKTIAMQPGDFVSFDSTLEKKVGCCKMLLAWKEHRLDAYDMPISQLATMINDIYGIRVRLEGDSTPYKTVTGMLQTDNLNTLLKAMEATTDFDITRDSLNNDIVIRARAHKK
ncbi:MAG TPA: FecR domain-containing protein [Puia sp.]|nr:FecR domain-containing protein [Puia sp.]